MVGQWLSWPPVSGAEQRVAAVVSALAELGDIDFFLLDDRGRSDDRPPHGAPITRFCRADLGRHRHGRRSQARWLLTGRGPYELSDIDFTEVRRTFARWARRYDLAWFVRTLPHVALGDLVACPSVVDVDDLEDHKVGPRLPSWPAGSDELSARWRREVLGLWQARNERAWRTLQRRSASKADLAAVCSPLDRARLGTGNTVVVPNGVEPPAVPSGRVEVSSPPTICFPGSLTYPPNVDAANRLVEDVLPRVGDRLPGCAVRLVGRAGPSVAALHSPPRMVVTGQVPSMPDELARSDLVAVPLRYGGGTRVKILEALAHRVPVVSTSIGAEGLDVVPDRHLLVADTPGDFAAACAKLIDDPALRESFAEAGRQLVLERYHSRRTHEAVLEMAGRIGSPRSE